MTQRLGIARTLVNNADLVILDEPTNGLDPAGIREVRELIRRLSKERGKAVLVSSHPLTEVEQVADTLGILHQGTLVDQFTLAEFRTRHRPCGRGQPAARGRRGRRLVSDDVKQDPRGLFS